MRNNIALQMADAWEANLILECPTEGLERPQKKMIKTIKIEGMHCPNCVAAVKRELEAIEGVSKVDVSLEDAQAIVEVEDVADETLQEAIEDIGFDVVEIK
jgi:copper chaperone CopZ